MIYYRPRSLRLNVIIIITNYRKMFICMRPLSLIYGLHLPYCLHEMAQHDPHQSRKAYRHGWLITCDWPLNTAAIEVYAGYSPDDCADCRIDNLPWLVLIDSDAYRQVFDELRGIFLRNNLDDLRCCIWYMFDA